MSKVKALITAAGMGKRFGILTKKTNKCLFHVEGKPLIGHLTDRLRSAGIRDIYLVSGHQHHEVEKSVKGAARLVFNPFYQVSGILGSFWAAKPYLEGKPFLFTTSDHFFHPSVLRDCLRGKRELNIVVQKKKSYTKEDSKVIIKNSRVVRLGKDIPVREANGEYGGMAYFGPRASKLFFRELFAHFEKGQLNGYMMEIMALVSRKYSIPIGFSVCTEDSRTEVDSVHDLIHARGMARKFKNAYKGDYRK